MQDDFDNSCCLRGAKFCLVVVLAACSVGCANRQKNKITQTTANTGARSQITKDEAVQIAEKQYISQNGPTQVTSHIDKSDNNGYTITVESLPATPGRHA